MLGPADQLTKSRAGPTIHHHARKLASRPVRYRRAGVEAPGPVRERNLYATFHRFRSDRLGRRYGTEWDVLAGVRRDAERVRASPVIVAYESGQMLASGGWRQPDA